MDTDIFFHSIVIGIGLAMDAFSLSLINGIQYIHINKRQIVQMASIYAFFQFLMPLVGWLFIHTMKQRFLVMTFILPWISLIILVYMGVKMLQHFCVSKEIAVIGDSVSLPIVLLQGVATSIDALSAGLMIVEYTVMEAIICAMVIAIITFILCFISMYIGKQAGIRFARYATLLGGVILLCIGIKIFLEGILRIV